MAISTSFADVQKAFNPRYWDSIDEFEQYYLRRIQETMSDRNFYTDRNGEEKQIDRIDHFPELKEYEVWSEGYAIQGDSSGASLLGKAYARNFAQACNIVMCKRELEQIQKDSAPDNKEYVSLGTWDYDPFKLKVWGCSLYWSKYLASRTFG